VVKIVTDDPDGIALKLCLILAGTQAIAMPPRILAPQHNVQAAEHGGEHMDLSEIDFAG
jgi:hypothetical protein